jgi:hypothetical protein
MIKSHLRLKRYILKVFLRFSTNLVEFKNLHSSLEMTIKDEINAEKILRLNTHFSCLFAYFKKYYIFPLITDLIHIGSE